MFLNRRKNMVKLRVYTRGDYTIVHRPRAGELSFLLAWSKASRAWATTADHPAKPRVGMTITRKPALISTCKGSGRSS